MTETPVAPIPTLSPSAEPTATMTPGTAVDIPAPGSIELIFPAAAGGSGLDLIWIPIIVALIAAIAAISAAIMARTSARLATVTAEQSAKRRDLWDQINWSVDTALRNDPVATMVGIRSAHELLEEDWVTPTDRRRVIAMVSEIVP